jgi:hypothetical protein
MLPVQIKPTEDRIQAVVGHGMRLLATYDPDQHWFAFMNGFVINVWDRTPRAPNLNRVTNVSKFAKMSKNGRVLFNYEKDVPQYVLPFKDSKVLSKADFRRLEQAHFPCWDRTDDDQPIVIPVKKEHNSDVRAWCIENCVGRFHLRPHTLFLERREDMVMAAIFWQGPEKAPYRRF